MLKRSRVLASAAVMALVTGLGAPAWAETLQEAIALAYQTNPSLLAQRASQRALDETVVQARSGLRPTLSASAGVDYTRSDFPTVSQFVDTNGDGVPDTQISSSSSESDGANVGVSLSQNIWTAGRTSLSVDRARANVMAGRENLREIEQSVMLSVIQAYVNVTRDMEILRIRQENLAVLQRQLDETSARFEVGEITRTDVAQAEASLAQSEADLANAQAQLSTTRAAYAAVVGQSPSDLEAAPALPIVPTDFDAAMEVALARNPGVLSAGYSLQAAEAAVASARAEYLPSVRATASYGGTATDLGNLDELADRRSFTAGATLSVPLFTGGLNRSRVAQALEQANAAQIAVEGERRTVLQNVSSAFAQVLSTRANVAAGEEAVRAASVAAEGVRQEAQVGLRTTLDVLNQEVTLRASQTSLANARAAEYVARASLLSAMGQLEGENLNANLDVYDAKANYDRVRNRGGLPWDGVIEALDRVAAPPVVDADDAPDAPIDAQLKGEVVRTAPRS
ncbi:TolC family outer membrane protein [Brevundimonas sp.]|jgi:outer membrane protein|uniref:TolC family outer membrane protein n=1 Tax=Brevundimonas sp. TaxID=1871086 RepID=UPI00181ABD8F|nr:TolC family outer membrane protein [Brevundimonas sp.]MBA4806202.1 TolC family outer membrane protein [Brevundimonas sp.]